MKVIKLALISFIFLFTVVWLISLLIPSRVRISRAVNMYANRDSVMAGIKDPSRWKTWYPGLDSAKPLLVDGKLKGMIVDEKSRGQMVYLSLDSIKPDEVTVRFVGNNMKPVINTWTTISYSYSDSLTLQWYMDFNLRWYPWEKFASLLLDKSYGPQMEKGLTKLKNNVQASLSSNK